MFYVIKPHRGQNVMKQVMFMSRPIYIYYIVKNYFVLFRPHAVRTAVCDSTLLIEHYNIRPTRFVTIIGLVFHMMLFL